MKAYGCQSRTERLTAKASGAKEVNTMKPLKLTLTRATLLATLALAALLPAPLCAQTNCTPPPSGLVAWWPGDGNALDLVGTNHGTPFGGATYAPGLVGQAFSFDGIDDVIIIPQSQSLDVQNAFTFGCWARADEQKYCTIMVRYGPGTDGYGIGTWYDGRYSE
jgi:hypothetical protein